MDSRCNKVDQGSEWLVELDHIRLTSTWPRVLKVELDLTPRLENVSWPYDHFKRVLSKFSEFSSQVNHQGLNGDLHVELAEVEVDLNLLGRTQHQDKAYYEQKQVF